MFETIKNAFKIKEIRSKILWTLFFLLLYRIGCSIPVPGVGSGLFEDLSSISYLNIMSMMSGGSLEDGTWFAMGIGPYINASIIIQLLTVAIPALERAAKSGEEGQKKINAYTRIGALLLAIVQSIGILVSNQSLFTSNPSGKYFVTLLGGQVWLAYVLLVIIYTSGTLATIFIGERITEKGVSNGISLLIFVGILSTAGTSFLAMINTAFFGGGDLTAFWKLVAYIVAIIVVFGCIVFVELSERKVPVQYAKQIKGRKQYGGQTTFIPIKVNSNGVMPLIFAFSILSFPELLITMFWSGTPFHIWWQTWMGTSSWLYTVLLVLLIFAFAFFYSQ
ncbi:MAG: preprotein translocase subunit SecY, partial [Clostridia bacterium]|nr:preprotein translocase subunit SecY [Clostridia bacterium]